MEKCHYVYILECKDNTLYTGYTTDPTRRLKEHNKGVGAKYTRVRLPVKLVYSQKLETRGNALSREYEIKKLKRENKLKLISSNQNELNQI